MIPRAALVNSWQAWPAEMKGLPEGKFHIHTTTNLISIVPAWLDPVTGIDAYI